MKPILFNTVMVQAILEGRKTTTRRIIKVNNSLEFMGFKDGKALFGKGCCIHETIKPPYMPGDILYVRETWAKICDVCDRECIGCNKKYAYKADGNYTEEDKWKPSIHMPKDATRIFLKITSVKIERLKDITHRGVIDEGTPYYEEMFKFNICLGQDKAEFFLKSSFKDLWNSTVNKKDIEKYGWNANPYVWVIEFELIEKSEVEQ
nr:MAG TPA_asm: ASCH domain protein [Caudoviricetes sp.]